MVSIGIQNESGVQHNAGHVPKKRPKTKTIICMDAAIQTGKQPRQLFSLAQFSKSNCPFVFFLLIVKVCMLSAEPFVVEQC